LTQGPPDPRPPRRRALGRGLDALLAASYAEEAGPEPVLVNVDPNSVSRNPEQPRRDFDEASLESLGESIRLHGLLHPVVVERCSTGYQLVAGERRLLAAQRAGVSPIPAMVRPASESGRQSLELALTENLHRADLNPIEQAAAYTRLQETFGLSSEAIAVRLGRGISTIENTMRLLRLAAPVQEALAAGRITMGHARALIVLPEEEQLELATEIEAKGMSVRVIESLVQSRLSEQRAANRWPPRPRPNDVRLIPDDEAVRRGLEQALGLPVALRRRRRGGDVVVTFASDEDLSALYDRLGAPPL
jgi:ParB family transcriptional regulator, chromosome partitioning protein